MLIELEIFIALLVVAVVAALVLLRLKVLSDRRLRNAIDALPAGIAFYDRSDRLYLWNGMYHEISGACRKLLRRGVRFRELLEEDLRNGHYSEAKGGREQAWLDARMALRAKGEGSREQRLGDGRWLRVQDRRSADGGTVSICVDVTDIKLGEDSFKLMFDNNPVPMWLWEGGKSLSVLDLNQAALDHLGYSRADIPGLSVFDLLSDEERPALNAMIASGIVRPYDGERIWRPRRADGTLLFAIPYIHILPRDGKRLFVGAIVDVTDRVRAEQELRRNADELSEALTRADAASRAKSEFLAAMSHELRTPLNAILGFSDILQSESFGPVGNARYREYAQSIHASGAHLLGLINDILDLSRLDSGHLELTREPLDLDALAEDCVQDVAALAERENIAVTHAVEPLLVTADYRRLKQMLLNLLSNAVKFTPKGGRVTLTARLDGEGLAIAVADTGIGMAPEHIPKALERFGQVDGSLARKYEGTGLGLPLTKALAELHGATLAIESESGTGTTVTIRFPHDAVLPHALDRAQAS
ncbi:MAG: PAS domain S-box protein [Alphaproteobacteria bacterium]|nr:PAS domain S-box protein [Alphaproteobacteria bacterium]